MIEPLLTEEQVSAWLQVSTEALRKMRQRGRIPFRKVGRAVRYERAAVEGWLAGETAPAEAPAPAPRHAGGRPRGGTRARLQALEEVPRRASA